VSGSGRQRQATRRQSGRHTGAALCRGGGSLGGSHLANSWPALRVEPAAVNEEAAMPVEPARADSFAASRCQSSRRAYIHTAAVPVEPASEPLRCARRRALASPERTNRAARRLEPASENCCAAVEPASVLRVSSHSGRTAACMVPLEVHCLQRWTGRVARERRQPRNCPDWVPLQLSTWLKLQLSTWLEQARHSECVFFATYVAIGGSAATRRAEQT
jgi:hypothetical protein